MVLHTTANPISTLGNFSLSSSIVSSLVILSSHLRISFTSIRIGFPVMPTLMTHSPSRLASARSGKIVTPNNSVSTNSSPFRVNDTAAPGVRTTSFTANRLVSFLAPPDTVPFNTTVTLPVALLTNLISFFSLFIACNLDPDTIFTIS